MKEKLTSMMSIVVKKTTFPRIQHFLAIPTKSVFPYGLDGESPFDRNVHIVGSNIAKKASMTIQD